MMKLFAAISKLFRSPEKSNEHQTHPEIDVAAAKVVYAGAENEFFTYYNLWLRDRQQFFALYHERFKNMSQIEHLSHLSIISSFGNHPTLYLTTDWRGEENEGEIQEFCEGQIKSKVKWHRADDLLIKTDPDDQRDGKFILQLFKAVDRDLQDEGYRLVFKETNSDSYQFTILRTNDAEELRQRMNENGYFLSEKFT